MPIDITKAELVGLAGDQVAVIQKDWGREHILPSNGYTTKIMRVVPGGRCSLHFHRNKNETFILIEGQLHVEFYEPNSTKHSCWLTEPLSAVVLPACTPHTFSVPKDQEGPSTFIESSTEDDPHDSYRLTKSGKNA